MSKKEKRILILEARPDCKALYVDYGDPLDPDGGMFCNKNGRYVRITRKDCVKCKSPVFTGITRAEAVEKMATALCQKAKNTEDCQLCSICWEEGCNRCDFSDFAEVALDALLCKEFKNAK
ncbi:MAG: hypothetical protein PUB86_04075 [Elusimicrobia bacterium]|nr:hypothetical protein [Elusimicrobiota bacterium]